MIPAAARRRGPVWHRPARAQSDSTADAIARLEQACSSGSGHVLVTGSDPRRVKDVLADALSRAGALATLRVRARDAEGGGLQGAETSGALLGLLEKARTERRAVFVVVEDADEATVEQLDRLRTKVDLAPDAIALLRLVLVGSAHLVEKLEAHAARALASRIAARVRVGPPLPRFARVIPGKPSWAFTTAAAVSFTLMGYGFVHVSRIAPQSEIPSRQSKPESGAAPSARAGLVGGEPFLASGLRIPIAPAWVTGSGLFPPPRSGALDPAGSRTAPAFAADPPRSGSSISDPYSRLR